MKPVSEDSETPTAPRRSDSDLAVGEATVPGAIGETHPFRFRAGWDPYEVWCTRVRTKGLGASGTGTLVQEAGPGGALPLKIEKDVLAGGKARNIPVAAWPVLLFAVVLGLNRELVGFFGVDLVAFAFGVMTPAARVVHVLLGISAICAVVVALRLTGRDAG